MTEEIVPARPSKTPLSMPVWAIVLYAAGMCLLGIWTGSPNGFFMVIAACMFSFQFWTIAAWRGLRHRQKELQ